jgi:outer membrane protein assembly factor BamB
MRTLICVVMLGAVCSAATAADWPQWLGPKRDAVWRETDLLDKFPSGGPTVLWRKPVGAGYAGPAVAGGKLIVTDRITDTPQVGGGLKRSRNQGTERVLCLDEKTGEMLWKHEYSVEYAIDYAAGPRCTPNMDGDRVYTLGAMGDLLCLDAAKGTVIWSKNFPKDYDSAVQIWGFAAHPLIDGDKLICLVGGSDGRMVVAFDKRTGRELWAKESGGSGYGYNPPVIYEFGGRRQLIVWHPAAVYSLDPETGKRLWKVDFTSNAALTVPMARKVGDDGLFVTAFYNGSLFLKVGADSADVVWRSQSKGERPAATRDLSSIIPTPFVDGDHIYGVCSYGQLRCIEARTGKRVWETMQATRGKLTSEKVAANPEPSDGERWSNAFIIRHDDRYFLFNEQGDLILARLTPKGYEEIDRTHILEPTNRALGRKVLWMHPAFADRCVFARNDNEIVCVSLAR